jgi:triacylglycerol lipase
MGQFLMPKPLPPSTVAALSPPPSAAFPYAFFQDAAQHPFLPDDAALTLRNAWWLIDAAFLAYSAPAEVEAAFARAGIVAKVQAFSSRVSTQCYVASANDWIVLAFRGTQVDHFWPSVMDWAIDARFVPAQDRHGNWVHAGFLSAINEVWQDVVACIAGLQAGLARPLWITGHSLGAALATLAANLCSDEHGLLGIKGLYTFGSPRVGDDGFRARIPCPAWRFRNDSDIVTHVPLGLVFRHVGELEFIDGGGTWHPGVSLLQETLLEASSLQLGASDAHNISALLELSGSDVVLPGLLADHAPINYAIRIWNCYQANG